METKGTNTCLLALHTAGNLKLAAHSLMCKHCFPLLVQNVPFVKASSTAYVLSHVFGLLQTPEWIVVQHSGPQWARVMFTLCLLYTQYFNTIQHPCSGTQMMIQRRLIFVAALCKLRRAVRSP